MENDKNSEYDVLDLIKKLPRLPEDKEFVRDVQRRIEEIEKRKKQPSSVKLTTFIREHIYAASLGIAAMIAVVYFSINYFSSDDRIDLTNQQINKIVVDLTNYTNVKVVPSIPDTLLTGLRTSVMNVQGKSAWGERVRLPDIEKIFARGAKGAK